MFKFNLRGICYTACVLSSVVGYTLSHFLSGERLPLIITICMGVIIVGLFFLGMFLDEEHFVRVNGERNSHEEQLVDELMEKVMLYCEQKGLNVAFMNTDKGLALAHVDDESGRYYPLVNLTLPAFGVLSDDNMDEYLKQMKMSVDSAIAQNGATFLNTSGNTSGRGNTGKVGA